MDRVERMLEELAERQIHADNRMDRLEKPWAEERKTFREDLNFLLIAVQGHVSQTTPPAHQGQ